MDVTEQAHSGREPRHAPLSADIQVVGASDDPATQAIATSTTTDQVIEALHSGGLLVLTMNLARQRSSNPKTPVPSSIGRPGVRRSVA
jgi:hypothetical protein